MPPVTGMSKKLGDKCTLVFHFIWRPLYFSAVNESHHGDSCELLLVIRMALTHAVRRGLAASYWRWVWRR